jgi:signal transduction histidine kinase
VSLYWRIVLPFGVGLVLIIGAGTLISGYLIGRDADRRLASRLGTVAQRVSRAGFALNRPLLDQLKAAVEAEVVVAGPGGDVIATTFGEAEAREAAGLATALAEHAPAAPAATPLETATVGLKEYKVLAIPISASGGSPQTLALFAPLAPIQASRAGVTRTLMLSSLGGLVLLFLWGHLITRSITRPIGRLVASTQAVAGGDLRHQAERPTIPELLALSEAFNHMVVKIRESEERLVRTERLATTGRIAATVAHEVRNPLTAIRMLAQLVGRSHQAGTRGAEACQNIIAEIDRLEMLVRGLLEATHARPLELTPLPVGGIIQDVAGLTGAQLRHRRIEVAVAADPDLPQVLADRDSLKQVLLNLVLNGADAMPDGGPLTITARRADSPDGTAEGLELAVADAGAGLSPEAERQAFEPFFTTKPEGAGLGLTVCRRIIEEHGGRITLANRPEGGAVARVWLPVGQG